jgi:hypothetical protein
MLDRIEPQPAPKLETDQTGRAGPDALLEQAARCRRLARSTTDPRATEILATMASEYAATAAGLKDR